MTAQCENCHALLPEGVIGGICPACLISLAKGPTETEAGRRLSPHSIDELEGRIPGIELRERIGVGGMGAVYRGYQVDLDREVAVKIVPESLTRDPVFVQRFRREAHALAKLDHPNIVTVFGSGVSDGLCYIVMEYIEGATLRQAINAKAVDPASALRIVSQICEALAYAHARGIVHRDIKPENILLGKGGRVKVVDFGLAKISQSGLERTMLTASGTRLGTLRYMAPEQLDGLDVDHRADVYSLGVVFYELLTGQIPMGQFALPSEKVGTDPRIDDVVLRTLSREPADRYQHVSDVEDELLKISRGDPVGWKHAHSRPHAWRKENTRWGSWQQVGREWKSKATIFGWPIVHIAYGYHPSTGRKLIAKGVIAIGDVAVGGLAYGGISFGIVSLGGVAAGINALGGCAIGLQVAAGGVAIGALAIGGAAIGLVALGGGAIGWLAIGGGAVGNIAIGGGTSGANTLNGQGWHPEGFIESEWITTLADDRMPWVAALAVTIMFLGPTLLVLFVALVGWFMSVLHGVAEDKMPGPAKAQLLGLLLGSMGGIICLLPVMSFLQLQPIQNHVSRVYIGHLQSKLDADKNAMQREIELLQNLGNKPTSNAER